MCITECSIMCITECNVYLSVMLRLYGTRLMANNVIVFNESMTVNAVEAGGEFP